jgi:hypothetical protein
MNVRLGLGVAGFWIGWNLGDFELITGDCNWEADSVPVYLGVTAYTIRHEFLWRYE